MTRGITGSDWDRHWVRPFVDKLGTSAGKLLLPEYPAASCGSGMAVKIFFFVDDDLIEIKILQILFTIDFKCFSWSIESKIFTLF